MTWRTASAPTVSITFCSGPAERWASQVPVLGLDGIERGLIDHGELLADGRRPAGRHRSMRATLDWSSSLLDEPARITLRRLAVLSAPLDLEAATDVAGFPPLSSEMIPAAIGDLVEHSLLTRTTGGGRSGYARLEPVRQFALATMTAQDQTAYLMHLRWCAGALAPLLDEADPHESLRALDDDVRGALAWAAGRALAEAHTLGQTYALLLRSGRLREAQDRFEAADDPASAAAVAKCRILGPDALRLELAAADAASGPSAALALVRAAELLTRFTGMFPEEIPPSEARAWIERAQALAPEDDRVAAAIVVADASVATDRGLAALERARGVGDVLLESAAMDAACADLIFAGDLPGAKQLAIQRAARLLTHEYDPAGALELKDALHTGVSCALGAGDLDLALDLARRQGELPFQREQRDLADEELLAPAALTGDWETALQTAQRFLDDWTSEGRPSAPGRGLSPAAVALVHGLRDDVAQRRQWLAVLAQIRGVPLADASVGCGYGELFDAMVLLHQGQPQLALEVLRRGEQHPGFYASVFRQWLSGLRAEAAVLAGVENGELDRARAMVAGNPVASAALARAEAAR